MTVNYGLLTAPDISGAFQSGYARGQGMRRQQVLEGALSAFAQNPSDPASVSAITAINPSLGLRLQDRQRQEADRQAMAEVFAPQQAAIPQAPSELVHPSALPPRSDGLNINKEALQRLYSRDPQAAAQIQKMVFDADKASFDRMQKSGEVMASAAYHLLKTPAEGRRALLDKMGTTLTQLGLTPQMLANADLSDEALKGYLSTGQDIKDLISQDLAERKRADAQADREADNARADRVANTNINATNTRLSLAFRADRRAAEARAEGRTRFRERDKDRAAIAAGGLGLRTDLSDLDY